MYSSCLVWILRISAETSGRTLEETERMSPCRAGLAGGDVP